MKILIALVSLLVFSSGAFAQTLEERLQNLEESLKKQERTIQELKTLQKTVKRQEQTIEEQRKVMEQLKAGGQQPQPSTAAAAQTAAPERVQQEVRELKEKVDEVSKAQQKDIPSVFNPAIGLVGETIFSYRSKGSAATGSDRPGGFDVNQRSVELDLAASIDPFAKAYAVINASADPITGEATLGVEEAALVTTSLPWNLELKAGRFFAEFGRFAYFHDHELPFVNRPLVLDGYIGGESRTDGAQLNYLLPIPHYVSLTLGVGDQFGGDNPPNDVGNFRQFKNLNFWGRTSTYFDLTPEVSFETGISGLWNPKTKSRGDPIVQADGSTLTERERGLAGADFTVSYKPLQSNQFQSLTWGTEVLFSNNRFDVAPTDSDVFQRSIESYGLYSYLTYKFHREWSAGFLFDWVESARNDKDRTFGYSPYITWSPSHWSQLRLQYTHTQPNAISGLSPDDAVYMQWTWIIGSHAHGWQAR